MKRRTVFILEVLRSSRLLRDRLRAALSLLTIMAIFAGMSHAADFIADRRAGNYRITVRMERNPPILGTNPIEVEVRDSGGTAVSDASVLVHYYMPPMPRMVPMNYKSAAAYKSGKYRTTMNFIMSGPWVVAVKVSRNAENATAKFNISVP